MRNILDCRAVIEKKVMALFESLDIPVSVTDDTVNGDELRVDFKELWPEQEKAVANLLVHDNGILCGTTAFGKTVCALNIIAEKKVNTLIVVNKTSLVSMWQEKIQAFLDFPDTENERKPKSWSGSWEAERKADPKDRHCLLQSLYHKVKSTNVSRITGWSSSMSATICLRSVSSKLCRQPRRSTSMV